MAKTVAESRLKMALASRVPRNAAMSVAAGDLVRVFRETGKHYVGPFPIIRVGGKQVFVLQGDREVQFSTHKLSRHLTMMILLMVRSSWTNYIAPYRSYVLRIKTESYEIRNPLQIF